MIKDYPKFEYFVNELTLNDLYDNFKTKYLSNSFPKEQINTFNFSKVDKLEDIVLVTLFLENQQATTFFTTTEISHLIQKHFGTQVKKHKDNISRYFNQRFYPYYEVKYIDGKNKYTLTPTGKSKAYLLILKYLI